MTYSNPYLKDSDAADKEWLHETFFDADWCDDYYDEDDDDDNDEEE